MKIVWSPLAIDRAAEIAAFISSDNPAAAREWLDKIFAKIALLSSSPEIGRVVPEIERKEIREIIFGNYRIIYRLESVSISILTIRHGKQLLPVDEILT
ncbi:MAG: plasmid stabilization protein [Deltaproteobacteria bacterium RIFOXYD12_FULL_56_24]|nr:MAG: plasmid stabilization protein [Deltaproteobacteria bacterium RIFOXYD12_FULL_56_24]